MHAICQGRKARRPLKVNEVFQNGEWREKRFLESAQAFANSSTL